MVRILGPDMPTKCHLFRRTIVASTKAITRIPPTPLTEDYPPDDDVNILTGAGHNTNSQIFPPPPHAAAPPLSSPLSNMAFCAASNAFHRALDLASKKASGAFRHSYSHSVSTYLQSSAISSPACRWYRWW